MSTPRIASRRARGAASLRGLDTLGAKGLAKLRGSYQVTHRAKALRTSSLEMPTHCVKVPKPRFNDMSTKEEPAVLLNEYDRLLDRMTAAGVKGPQCRIT